MDPKRLLVFLRLIEKIPIEYMVTGSIAAILYGKPRLTHDMDVVVVFPRYKVQDFCPLRNLGDEEQYLAYLEAPCGKDNFSLSLFRLDFVA